LKSLATTLILAASLVALSGCGNSVKKAPATTAKLASGNWIFYVNSTTPPPVGAIDQYPTKLPLRGSLTTSSSALTIAVTTNGGIGAPCFPQNMSLAGTVDGSTAILTPTPNDSALTITASPEPVSILLGNYTCKSESVGVDNGTFFGTNVPALDGNWTGTLSDSNKFNGAPATGLTTALKQASTVLGPESNSPGAFALSGTVTVSNTQCFNSGSADLIVDNTLSYITGEQVSLTAVSADGNTVFHWNANLDDPSAATSMTLSSSASLQGNSCSIYFASTSSIKKS